ncbi:hypothetical protein CBL_05371 [Carabus blaptoides fortunei]
MPLICWYSSDLLEKRDDGSGGVPMSRVARSMGLLRSLDSTQMLDHYSRSQSTKRYTGFQLSKYKPSFTLHLSKGHTATRKLVLQQTARERDAFVRDECATGEMD